MFLNGKVSIKHKLLLFAKKTDENARFSDKKQFH